MFACYNPPGVGRYSRGVGLSFDDILNSIQNFAGDASNTTGTLTADLLNAGATIESITQGLQTIAGGGNNATQAQILIAQQQLAALQAQQQQKTFTTIALVAGGGLLLWFVMKKKA